jgi:hypothetical protein
MQAIIVVEGKDWIIRLMNQLPVMKGWRSYILWEGLPFLILLFVFGFISTVNWEYESKPFTLNRSTSDSTSVHLGLILLAFAMGEAIVASFLLFVVRIVIRMVWPNSSSGWFKK